MRMQRRAATRHKKGRHKMRIYYREQADKDGHHYIYRAVLDRDIFDFEPSINTALLEMDIDEVGANAAFCRDLRWSLGKWDAGAAAKYYVIAGAVNEDINWVHWIDPVDPEDGREPPPVLEPRLYQPVTIAVDVDKVRLKELSDQPSMTAADEAEALRLVMKRSVTVVRERQ